MKEVVRTTSAGLPYTYLTDFIGSEANMTFINNTALPEIVLQINQREPLPGTTPMLVIQVRTGKYESITSPHQQRTGINWSIRDQAVIQAEAFKVQRKAFGADRARLNQRTPRLIQGGAPAVVNRRRLNQWALTNPTTRKLRVVPSGAPSSSSSSGMEREANDDQLSVAYSPSMSSSSSSSGFTSSSGLSIPPVGGGI
jgi:hypothetical protein